MKFKKLRTKLIATLLVVSMLIALCACGAEKSTQDSSTDTGTDTTEVSQEDTEQESDTLASEYTVPYEFLTKEECADTLGGLTSYYDSLSQKSLDYFTQKKGATKEEYIEYSKEQACDFTDEEKAAIEDSVEYFEQQLEKAGMKLPENVSVKFATTTMNEALGAGGYTHGTTIFLGNSTIDACIEHKEGYDGFLNEIVAHEIFHCLTRNNPEFRKAMYQIIGFTVTDSDFEIPEYVHEQMISNPDVGHHDSYATFTINGEKKDCYLVFLTEDNFEKPGDSFFTNMYTGLVDINDGSLYSYEDAEDFYDVVGRNTTYCEDPEECMATNFSYAVVYGLDGKDGEGYDTPSIIEDIISYMQK